MSIILLIDQQNPTSVDAREGFSIKFGNLMSIFVILVLVCAFKHVCVCIHFMPANNPLLATTKYAPK